MAKKLKRGSEPCRLAMLLHPMHGQFSRWQRGEIVEIISVRGSSYCIGKLFPEKLLPKEARLPLFTQVAGLPRWMLKVAARGTWPKAGRKAKR
jgi:hypothetical protein